MSALRRHIFPVLLGGFLFFSFLYLTASARWMPLDYDEIQHVHASWLISTGLKPYADFHEMHAPFFWLGFSPVLKRLPETFESLLTLRKINVVFSVLALAFLALLVRRQLEGTAGAVAAMAALSLMFVQPTVVQVLSDFRADHLSLALIFLALLIIPKQESRRTFVSWVLPVAVFSAALALDSKLIFIPLIALALFGLSEYKEGPDRFRSFLLGSAIGLAGTLAVAWVICMVSGIDVVKIFRSTFVFHYRLSRLLPFHQGLAKELFNQATNQYAVMTVVFLMGLAAVGNDLRKHRMGANKIFLILTGYALAQALFVKFSFKQYIFSVYLLWTGPLAFFLAKSFQGKRRFPIAALYLLLLVPSVYFEWGRWEQIRTKRYTDGQIKTGNEILRITPPGEPVFAQPPFHPVFRRDALYSWIENVVAGGLPTEDIMLGFPEFKEWFTDEGYRDQLNRNPPSLIVLPAASERRYAQALNKFLRERGREYEAFQMGSYAVYLKRPPGG